MAEKEKEKHKTIESLIGLSVQSLSELIDVDTVIGKPIFSASGSQIIPFTKVTVGYLTGGGEYGDAKVIQSDGRSFAGGAGSVVTMKPCGFLIDDGKGCRLVKITDEPCENLMEKAEGVISRFTADRNEKEKS